MSEPDDRNSIQKAVQQVAEQQQTSDDKATT
jgi:hypothetical protein